MTQTEELHVKRRRVVITGGAGFLGSHLCDYYLGERYEVICYDDLSTGRHRNVRHLVDEPRFTLVEQDVTRGELSVAGPVYAVLHFASPASPADYLRLPLETLAAGSTGTRNALDLAAEKHARFLLASTSEVYGDPLEHPQPETYWGNVNPIGPRSVYDEAKRFGEAITAAYRAHRGVDARIVRIFNTFGPRMRDDDGRMVPTFIKQAVEGKPLTVTGTGRQTRSLSYVEDTVDGIARLLRSDHSGPVNIGGDHEMTVLEVAELIKELTASPSAIDFVPPVEDDPQVRRPDLNLAGAALEWRPRVRVREGLRRTVEWHRSGDAGLSARPALVSDPRSGGARV